MGNPELLLPPHPETRSDLIGIPLDPNKTSYGSSGDIILVGEWERGPLRSSMNTSGG
jgi:hypothetical protein